MIIVFPGAPQGGVRQGGGHGDNADPSDAKALKELPDSTTCPRASSRSAGDLRQPQLATNIEGTNVDSVIGSRGR